MLTGKHPGKIALGTSRRRWEDNVRLDLKDRTVRQEWKEENGMMEKQL